MTKNDIGICYSFFGDDNEKNILFNIYFIYCSNSIKLHLFKG